MPSPAPLYTDADILKGAVDAAQVIAKHDMVFLNTDDIRAAALQAEVTNEAGTQLAFGPKFLGVSLGVHTANDPAVTDFPVARRFVGEFDCTSAAYEVGERVCPAYNTDKLHNQTLKKTTVEGAAIGIVVKKSAGTVTRVTVELISKVVPYYLHTETP